MTRIRVNFREVFPNITMRSTPMIVTLIKRRIFEYERWCNQNAEVGKWAYIGLNYSNWLFTFENEEDATAFRLRFGV